MNKFLLCVFVVIAAIGCIEQAEAQSGLLYGTGDPIGDEVLEHGYWPRIND